MAVGFFLGNPGWGRKGGVWEQKRFETPENRLQRRQRLVVLILVLGPVEQFGDRFLTAPGRRQERGGNARRQQTRHKSIEPAQPHRHLPDPRIQPPPRELLPAGPPSTARPGRRQ